MCSLVPCGTPAVVERVRSPPPHPHSSPGPSLSIVGAGPVCVNFSEALVVDLHTEQSYTFQKAPPSDSL